MICRYEIEAGRGGLTILGVFKAFLLFKMNSMISLSISDMGSGILRKRCYLNGTTLLSSYHTCKDVGAFFENVYSSQRAFGLSYMACPLIIVI